MYIQILYTMKSVIYSITANELQTLINQSKTYGQVLKYFGLENRGANARTLKQRIKSEHLNDTHLHGFKFGGGWNKGTTGIISRTMSLDDAMKVVFVKHSEWSVKVAKRLLIKHNLIPHKCFDCGLEQVWNNKSITLEIDHISGDSSDNRISNLRWLCPNCHSQTPTFRGRNKRKMVGPDGTAPTSQS